MERPQARRRQTSGLPQANLTAHTLGLGRATADAFNRFSINTPAMLFNHAGGGIEATFSKNAPADDAAFAFKTGFSARALIGLFVNDDFCVKVTLVNLGASFPVDSATNVLTLFRYAAPNAASVWVRVVDEVSGAIAAVEITANLPASIQLLSPRNYMNTGSTAAAVAYECSGVHVETDY